MLDRLETAERHIDAALSWLELAKTFLIPKHEHQHEAPLIERVGIEHNQGPAPHNLLDIAQAIIEAALAGNLRQRALKNATTPRDYLFQSYTISCEPRGIMEPIATILIMIAAAQDQLRHALIYDTEQELELPHKAPIQNLEVFVLVFTRTMLGIGGYSPNMRMWIERDLVPCFPDFRNKKRLMLPNGDYIVIPEQIAPIQHPAAPASPVQMRALTISSPIDPHSPTVIPTVSDYSISTHVGDKLNDPEIPEYHMQRHSGLDIAMWNCYGEPVYAMLGGKVIESKYRKNGFGHTVVVEHDYNTCMSYTHLDKRTVQTGDRIERGDQVGTIGKGEGNRYAAHLHLDLLEDRDSINKGTYFNSMAELRKWYIDPLSRIAAWPGMMDHTCLHRSPRPMRLIAGCTTNRTVP